MIVTSFELILAGALLWSGVHHVARLRDFGDLLRDHAIVPRRFATSVAGAVALVELVLAGGYGLSRTGSLTSTAVARSWSAATLLLLLAFALYVSRLLQLGRSVSCGCGGPETDQVSGWTLMRTGVLAGLALLSFARPDAAVDAFAGGGGELIAATAAAASIGTALWVLPTAMSQDLGGQP